MPDNTSQDHLAEDQQVAEELQDSEGAAQAQTQASSNENMWGQKARRRSSRKLSFDATADSTDEPPQSDSVVDEDSSTPHKAEREETAESLEPADADLTVEDPTESVDEDLTEPDSVDEESAESERIVAELIDEEPVEEEPTEAESTDVELVEVEQAEEETVEIETVDAESTEPDSVDEELAEPESVHEDLTESEPALESDAFSDPEPSTDPETPNKSEAPQKKPMLERVDGYVDELSRELDLEFAEEADDPVDEREEQQFVEPVEDLFEDSANEREQNRFATDRADDADEQDDHDDMRGLPIEREDQHEQDDHDDTRDLPLEQDDQDDITPDPEYDDATFTNDEPEFSLAEDKIEEEQLEEERVATVFKKPPRRARVIPEEPQPAHQPVPEPAPQPKPQPTRRSARETPRKERHADPQASRKERRDGPQIPRKERRDAQQAPQQRTKNKPKAPTKRVTRTYLQSPSLKQAFRSFGKLKGGLAWREVYAPVIVFMLLFALLALAVVDSLPIVDSFNQAFNAFVHQTRGPLDAFVITLTTIGDFLPMAGICLLVCAVLYLGRKWDSLAYFITNALLSIVCIQALKFIFAVPRPGDETLVPLPLSFSFPSAHSFCSLVIFGMIGLLIFRALYARGIARKAAMAPGIVLIIFALFIGLSRIYVGVHWPSDVLGGWLLAGAWLAFAGALYTAGARQR